MKPYVKIKPFVSAGEAFVSPDGKLHVLPLSIFPLKGGGTCLRVGNTTYRFNPDGSYDGPEMAVSDRATATRVGEVLAACAENRDNVPASTYFQPGCEGYDAEVAVWPARPSKGDA